MQGGAEQGCSVCVCVYSRTSVQYNSSVQDVRRYEVVGGREGTGQWRSKKILLEPGENSGVDAGQGARAVFLNNINEKNVFSPFKTSEIVFH